MSDKIQTYQDARALGLSHEAALEVAHISRAIDYAAHVASGMASANAAKAAGYASRPDGATKALAARALEVRDAAAEAKGAWQGMCPNYYRTRRAEIEGKISALQAQCDEMRQLERACLALALSECGRHPTSHTPDSGDSADG
jgi:hypothetical protein